MFEGRQRSVGFALAVTLASTTLAQGQVCGMPAKLDDGWTIAAPDDVGLDGERLCTIEQRLKLTDADIHAVVIARHGKLAFEQYFAGLDQPWGKAEGRYDYDATTSASGRTSLVTHGKAAKPSWPSTGQSRRPATRWLACRSTRRLDATRWLRERRGGSAGTVARACASAWRWAAPGEALACCTKRWTRSSAPPVPRMGVCLVPSRLVAVCGRPPGCWPARG